MGTPNSRIGVHLRPGRLVPELQRRGGVRAATVRRMLTTHCALLRELLASLSLSDAQARSLAAALLEAGPDLAPRSIPALLDAYVASRRWDLVAVDVALRARRFTHPQLMALADVAHQLRTCPPDEPLSRAQLKAVGFPV